MKLLLIHSDGVEMTKMAKATSKPQEYKEKGLKLDGLVLVVYVSVEDQDTFDVNIISNQAAGVIKEAIDLIEGFPQRIDEMNKGIKKFNDGLVKKKAAALKNPKIKLSKEKPREMGVSRPWLRTLISVSPRWITSSSRSLTKWRK